MVKCIAAYFMYIMIGLLCLISFCYFSISDKCKQLFATCLWIPSISTQFLCFARLLLMDELFRMSVDRHACTLQLLEAYNSEAVILISLRWEELNCVKMFSKATSTLSQVNP